MTAYPIGPLHDPVTWYGINYAGTQITRWDFQNKGNLVPVQPELSFGLKVPLRYLRFSIIYSVPCDQSVQGAYSRLEDKNHTLFKTTMAKKNHPVYDQNGR